MNDRSLFIGSSDAAAILAVSKWKSPLDLYREKIGEAQPTEVDVARERIFRRGKRLEPIVIDMLADEYGVEVTKRSPAEARNYHVDPEFDFLRAEIDFEFRVTPELCEKLSGLIDPALLGTIQNGEIKTSHPNVASANFGEMFTEEIPIDYAAQSMHGMMVTGRKFCLYGVLVGADNLLLFGLKRDEETIAGLRARELAFWRCVQERMPPDPVNMGDVLSLMYRLNGRPIEATPAIAQRIVELGQIRGAIKVNNDAEESIKLEIAQFVFHSLQELNAKDPRVTLEDDTAITVGGKTALTWKGQVAVKLDSKRLKAAEPGIWEMYSKEQHSRVMRLK